MKKRYLLVLAAGLSLILAGCGGSSSGDSSGTAADNTQTAEAETEQEQKVDADGNIILDEYYAESGEIEPENTDEETGEVVEQVEVDFDVQTNADLLTIQTTNGGITDGTWKYLISDENIVTLQSEEDAEDGGKVYTFQAKSPGDAVIGISFFAPDDETEITPEDVTEGFTDVSVDVRVNDELRIGMRN